MATEERAKYPGDLYGGITPGGYPYTGPGQPNIPFSDGNVMNTVGGGLRSIAPAAGAVAMDTLALIPRAFEYSGDNFLRGITGRPANQEPFVMAPNIQRLMSAPSATTPVAGGGVLQPGTINPDLLAENAPMTSISPSSLPDMLDVPQSRGLQGAGGASQPAPNITDPVMADRVNRMGLSQALQSPAPNINYSMMRNDDGKGYTVRETINGGLQPFLKEPMSNIGQYQTRTGWDKQGRPIYTSGAAEMAAVNAGIADFNKTAIDTQTGRNKLWAEQVGGIPLQQAQAAEASARAATIPENSRSLTEYHKGLAAQALAGAEAKDWVPYKYEELVGDPKFPEKVERQGFFSPSTGETRTPMQAAKQVESALTSPATPEERSLVLKHFGDRKDLTTKDINSYIQQLRTARGL